MNSILEACQPRPEILTGTFNPEVFTASLGPVAEYYRTGRSQLDTIYTDAVAFFRDATFPTQGLRSVLSEVFGRVSGDGTVPAIHRLETAFGGGKTHALIACTHLAHRGIDLASVTGEFIDGRLLSPRGSVSVVTVMGDEIPVHKPVGNELIPYTLWGEIAYQIGGETLYQQVREEATSFAAPGKTFLDRVIGGRKVLILLDELAQYAARLGAARSDGAEQLASFLMLLHGYARARTGISIVLTLAGSHDAFSKQTGNLARLLSDVSGREVSEDEALGLSEQAVSDVSSVVARDASQVVPVHASEISSILAKRLFLSIDRSTAEAVADQYMEMYRRNASSLPETGTRQDFRDRMISNYPFHPTLIDYLTNKLSEVETFQGTRGVLRVLSLAVKSIWEKRSPVPMVHVCHLDLRNDRVVAEIVGRTGNSELLNIVNADIGGVDTGALESGRSNAQTLDLGNPHPKGFPMHELAWRTVFFNSLVGRNEGVTSRVFGVSEPEAVFQTSFPELTPTQVKDALKQIEDNAFYLKWDQGKYYASPEPTINNILARIRRNVGSDEIGRLLQSAAQKVVVGASGPFQVEHDVSQPEDIPDRVGRPILAVVSLTAGLIDIDEMITTRGRNKPREHQNLVILLVPETVSVRGAQSSLFANEDAQAEHSMGRISTTARFVAAMRILNKTPQAYGVNPRRLDEDSYKRRYAEREQALVTDVSSAYTRFYHPSTSGHTVRRDIRTATGEGGRAFVEQIRETLAGDWELLGSRNTTQSDLTNFGRLLFPDKDIDTAKVDGIRMRFLCRRDWPMIEAPEVCEQIVRIGVQKGAWCVFRMESAESSKPSEIYYRNKEIPMSASLLNGGYWLITVEGAKKRGWLTDSRVSKATIRASVTDTVKKTSACVVASVKESVIDDCGEVPYDDFSQSLCDLLREGSLICYQGTPEQVDRPATLIQGPSATAYVPQANDVLITPAEAARRGWLVEPVRDFHVSGRDGANKIVPLLRQIGALYNRGAKSTINLLDLVDLELGKGGHVRIQLTDVPAESMKHLDEFLEVVAGLVKQTPDTEADLLITDPDYDCILIKALSGKVDGNE